MCCQPWAPRRPPLMPPLPGGLATLSGSQGPSRPLQRGVPVPSSVSFRLEGSQVGPAWGRITAQAEQLRGVDGPAPQGTAWQEAAGGADGTGRRGWHRRPASPAASGGGDYDHGASRQAWPRGALLLPSSMLWNQPFPKRGHQGTGGEGRLVGWGQTCDSQTGNPRLSDPHEAGIRVAGRLSIWVRILAFQARWWAELTQDPVVT